MKRIRYERLFDICCDLADQLDKAMPQIIPSSPDVSTELTAQEDTHRLRNLFCYLVSEMAEVKGEMSFATATKVYEGLVAERMDQATFLEDKDTRQRKGQI